MGSDAFRPPWSHGRPGLGAWVKIPAPEVVELLAIAGVDFVVIDREHGVHDLRTVSTMIAVARGCGVAPFVRVPGYTARDVVPVLDAGAAGLFLPHIDTIADTEAAVRACRFPPRGGRGAGPTGRAGRWGRAGLGSYLAEAGDVRLVAQLESPAGMVDAAAIAAVDGVDAVFVGEVDLAVSAGLERGDERFRGMVADTELSCAASGIPMGTSAANGAEALDLFARGHQFALLGNDSGFLLEAASRLVRESRPMGAFEKNS